MARDAVAVCPVVRSVCPLVSFALFAGGGGMLVAAAMSALSAWNRKLDAAGWPGDSADVIFKFGFHYPSPSVSHMS